MSLDPEPIDDLHRACLSARWELRGHAKVLADRAARWEPRPMPSWYRAGAREEPKEQDRHSDKVVSARP